MDETPQADTDAYYGDENVDSSELDLSFLDDDEDNEESGGTTDNDKQPGKGDQ